MVSISTIAYTGSKVLKTLGHTSYVSPKQIMPVPLKNQTWVQRERVKTRVLTDTSERDAIRKSIFEKIKHNILPIKLLNKSNRAKHAKMCFIKTLALKTTNLFLHDTKDTVSESKDSMNEGGSPKDIFMGDFVFVKFKTRDHW